MKGFALTTPNVLHLQMHKLLKVFRKSHGPMAARCPLQVEQSIKRTVHAPGNTSSQTGQDRKVSLVASR